MTYLSFFAVIALVLAVLAWMGRIPGFASGHQELAALRRLLLARASGEIDEAEFTQRQAALHAALLNAPAGSGQNRRWAAGFLAVAVVLGGLALRGTSSDDTTSDSTMILQSSPKAPALLDSIMPGRTTTGMSADMPAGAKSTNATNNGGDLKSLVKPLADKLAKDPGNGDGWLLLARTHRELRQHAEAVKAYEKAVALIKPDAATLAEWADAYVIAHDRKWDDTARGILKRALDADAKQPTALALAGSEAFARADYKVAIQYWKRMRAVAQPESMEAKLADSNIQEATKLMGGK